MYIPFHEELDDVFRGGRSIGLKMGGCAFATTFVVITTTLRGVLQDRLHLSLTATMIAALAGASAATGALLGLALSLKDVVRRRIALDEPVNPVLRLYFGTGGWSLVAWFMTVLSVTFLITTAILA